MNYDYFCDEAFKVAMRSVCKEYRSEYIDPAKVKEVRIEYAKSLADLEYLPNLESIHLLYAELNDVIRLKRLPRLTELIIEMCDISNIGAVWNLTGLTSLSISMSKVTKSKNATLPNNLRELFLCQRRNRFDRKRRAKMTQNAGYTTASHPTAGTFAGGVT